MLAGAIESGLMGRDLESSVRKSSRPNLVLRVDQDIEYPAALFTDEMLMALDERIEMLRPSSISTRSFSFATNFCRLR